MFDKKVYGLSEFVEDFSKLFARCSICEERFIYGKSVLGGVVVCSDECVKIANMVLKSGFSEWLLLERKDRGLTQGDISGVIGTRRARISDIENGKSVLRASELDQLCLLFYGIGALDLIVVGQAFWTDDFGKS